MLSSQECHLSDSSCDQPLRFRLHFDRPRQKRIESPSEALVENADRAIRRFPKLPKVKEQDRKLGVKEAPPPA